jgi:hypothetical protein
MEWLPSDVLAEDPWCIVEMLQLKAEQAKGE